MPGWSFAGERGYLITVGVWASDTLARFVHIVRKAWGRQGSIGFLDAYLPLRQCLDQLLIVVDRVQYLRRGQEMGKELERKGYKDHI